MPSPLWSVYFLCSAYITCASMGTIQFYISRMHYKQQVLRRQTCNKTFEENILLLVPVFKPTTFQRGQSLFSQYFPKDLTTSSTHIQALSSLK